jgi:hypothetical protein
MDVTDPRDARVGSDLIVADGCIIPTDTLLMP